MSDVAYDLYLITVKVPKNLAHNPRAKVTASCPAEGNHLCTDATGEHHTLLVWSNLGIEHVREWGLRHYGHVTRIELTHGVVIDPHQEDSL